MRQVSERLLRSATAALEGVTQRVTSADAALHRRLRRIVAAAGPSPTVVLLTGHGPQSPLSASLAGGAVALHEIDPVEEEVVQVRLAALEAVDVLVLDTAATEDRGALAEEVVLHLRPGGVLVVRDVDPAETGLESLLQRWADRGTVADAEADGGSSGGAVEVERFGPHAQVTVRGVAYLKLREEEANPYLALTGGRRGRVVQTRPAVHWTSRARVREGGDPPKRLPREYSVPEMNLRVYDDVRCLPGQVAVQGPVILPDSFRHNQRRHLGNQRLHTLAGAFAVPDEEDVEAAPLVGTYFYLDSSYRGHFGHAMTEQLSRLWAWPAAKELYPDLKAVLHEERRKGLFTFEKELYAAAGVPADDLVLAPGPVRVERLVAATPMFSQPQYIHPDLGQLWTTVSDALDARAEATSFPARIFCSRRHGKRACRNSDEVEQLFADHEFTIVYTEDHPLAEQARMFRQAEVVAGFAGSALFNLLLSAAPKQVVMLASENYWAQNEYMIASVLGHDVTLAWCKPERPLRAGQGFKPRTFHSPFTFDLEREGRLVRDVLAAL